MSTTVLGVALLVLGLGSLLITFKVMGRASKGYDKAKQRRAERGPAVPCSTCGSTMIFAGLQELSVTPASPEELGAAGGVWPLEVHRCPTCRKVELFLPPSAG